MFLIKKVCLFSFLLLNLLIFSCWFCIRWNNVLNLWLSVVFGIVLFLFLWYESFKILKSKIRQNFDWGYVCSYAFLAIFYGWCILLILNESWKIHLINNFEEEKISQLWALFFFIITIPIYISHFFLFWANLRKVKELEEFEKNNTWVILQQMFLSIFVLAIELVVTFF